MLLFLGSGVSRSSGLPGVIEITDQLLDGEYYRDSNEIGKYYLSDDGNIHNVEPMRNVQQLLRLLVKIDKHYLESIAPYKSGDKFHHTGSIYRSITTYEDLFYLTKQIETSGRGLTDEAPIGAFVDIVEEKAGNILEGKSRDERIICLYHLAVEAARFIEWMVARTLISEHVSGLDLVVEIANSQDIDRLDIITLNHDTLIETLLTKNNIEFIDGFGIQEGDVRWHDDSVYDIKEAKVRIIKPHGSVNWYSFIVNGRPYPALVVGDNPTNCYNDKGERLRNHVKTPSFLSGIDKILAYNKGIYSNMFYRFHELFREHELMVMSGYGWGDTAINFRLMNWLDDNRRNTIILLHQDPEELAKRSLQLDESYKALVQVGQIVPLRKWLSDTSLADLDFAVENH